MDDPESQLLAKLNKIEDFFRAVLQEDKLEDWNLAKDFGEFLIRIEPQEPMGHALLARAYRHLGSPECARQELEQCRILARNPSDVALFLSFVADENKLLPPGTTGP